jgi:DNA polymerase-3 subunit alpha
MDGVATPEEYMERAVANGMTAAAMTDHGTLSGHRAWVRAAKAHGVKPILGIEAYYSADRFDKRDKKERTEPLDRNYHHLIVLAKNDVGLENLNRMNEIAWNEGYYSKPRIDFDLLDKYGEGLIVSTACMGSFLNQAIENDDYAAAKAHLRQFSDRFGDDFYVEVMPHNIEGMNKALMELAYAGGHKIIVTPDCHHATVDQKVIQEIMLINNTHAKFEKDISYDKSRKIEDPMQRLDYLYGADRMMSFNNFDIHLLSYDEMRSAMQANMYGDLGSRSTTRWTRACSPTPLRLPIRLKSTPLSATSTSCP